jgi:CDP-diacylglycerol---serine O-phosphatidyltransferase
MKKHIPNTITSFNLVCGCIGIGMAVQGDLAASSYWIILAAVFDFFDGFAARLLKVSSPFGKEMDSLADLVSFGVLPGLIVFMMLNGCVDESDGYARYLPYIAFLIPVFSGLRLAKFNIDDRQSDSFIGLPVPANALFFASFPLILTFQSDKFLFITTIIANPAILIFLSVLMSFLLVSGLHLFALKFKGYGIKGNEVKYLFLLLSLLLILFMRYTAIPLIILLYILLSLIHNLIKK